jgi:hypothetical protein
MTTHRMELVVTMRIRLITVLCLLVPLLSQRTVTCRLLTQQWKQQQQQQQQQANDDDAAYVTGDRNADKSDKDALSIPLQTRSLKNKNDSPRMEESITILIERNTTKEFVSH